MQMCLFLHIWSVYEEFMGWQKSRLYKVDQLFIVIISTVNTLDILAQLLYVKQPIYIKKNKR